jgi:hypothetical protein
LPWRVLESVQGAHELLRLTDEPEFFVQTYRLLNDSERYAEALVQALAPECQMCLEPVDVLHSDRQNSLCRFHSCGAQCTFCRACIEQELHRLDSRRDHTEARCPACRVVFKQHSFLVSTESTQSHNFALRSLHELRSCWKEMVHLLQAARLSMLLLNVPQRGPIRKK